MIESIHHLRRFRIPLLGIQVEWHRYIHYYPQGDRRYVNQWHFIRDAG